MAKEIKYYYIVDKLDVNNAAMMRKSLKIVPEIKTLTIDAHHGLLEVQATSNVETQVKLACDIAGTIFRRQVKNRHF